MADRTVTVKLKVDDQFSQPINAYTAKMTQADQATQKAAQGASRAGQAFGQFGTMLQGAIIGVGIAGVARLGEELYTAGMNAQRAGMLFESFGDQVGSTDALLARLRQTTRGVVSDVDLMSAASSQLSMGLARNADDVERLTNIGVTFAQAMGQDVAESMSNLNMLLANQSYLRLDTLGISSSQVRELAGQYRAAGMDSSEAFTAAFMDVAEAKLPQMAAVADAVVSPFARLQTEIDNIMAKVADGFATGVNTLIDIAEHGGLLIRAALFGEGSAQAGNTAETNPNVALIASAQANLLQGQGLGIGLDTRRGGIGSLMGWALNTGSSLGDMGLGQARQIMGQPALMDYQVQALLESARYGLEQYNNAIEWGTQAQEALAQQTEQTTGHLETRQYSGNAIQDLIAGGQQRPMWAALMSEQGRYGDALSRIYGNDRSLFTGEEGQRAQMYADMMQRAADAVENMGLSDAIVNPMQEAAKQAAAMADNIERGNVAMVSMSELFGQSGGSQFDQMNQAVLAQMRANGATDEQLASAEQRMGLNSGAMTGMSVQWDNTIKSDLAEIWTQLGPDAYFAAQQAIVESWRRIRTENPDYTGPVPWDQAMQSVGIDQNQGSAYTVQPGDTVWGLAHAQGMTTEQYMAANGLDSSMLRIGQQIGSANQYTWNPAMMGNTADVQAETERQAQVAADGMQYAYENAFSSAVETFTSLLNQAAANVVRVPIEFVLANGGALNTLLSGAIAAVNAANGGTSPGTSAYTGKSSSGQSGSRGTPPPPVIGGGLVPTP